MKLTQFTLATATLLATVAAQGLGDLPTCAQSCATSSIPANCGLDIQCICADQSFLSDIACCVADKCSQADQETTLKVAKGICASGGVTNLPSTISCPSTASSSGTSESMTETMTATMSSTATDTTLVGSVTSTMTEASTTSSGSTGASTQAASSSSAATKAAATTGAAILGQNKDSSLMAAAGAAAAFAFFV
ncbi:Cell wall protein TIR3 [Penicillium canariense]|uniref:Cell wall protein TIR3 n=1 Tax=Penicillium canariense TaxID=189055 RepID=A0A9W9HYR7_9EURO|nr:Cell wall protein TIR3 [Penicillium canariense]KAJ5157519.1 Cell wall protein TIR3 [Penicillium canariense]